MVPTQPYWASLGAESRVCYPGNTADRKPQQVRYHTVTFCSQQHQDEKPTHCHCWGLNLQPLATSPALRPLR
jgi:hypothetical protein